MNPLRSKPVAFVIILLILGAIMWWATRPEELTPPTGNTPAQIPVAAPTSNLPANQTIIGTSVEGREIKAYSYGSGETHLLFVGGMHGGYEWNSVVLAEELIANLEKNPAALPSGVAVSIIPNLNPDGVFAVLGTTTGFTTAEALAIAPTAVAAGRFNKNGVDLNRNFDCKWAPESTWRGNVVSAGTGPFSEPEAQALRNYVTTFKPSAVIFWHSQANTVYASECQEGILPETRTLMNTYAEAANYETVEKFDAYPITGDAEGWLASLGIPAITVELESRDSSEWTRNIAGIEATVQLYGDQLAR